MKNDISVIKYLLIILAVSFLFACVAEAQSNKQLITGNAMSALSIAQQKHKEIILPGAHQSMKL